MRVKRVEMNKTRLVSFHSVASPVFHVFVLWSKKIMERFNSSYIEPKPYSIKLFIPSIPSGTFLSWRIKAIFIALILTAGLSTPVLGQIKTAKSEMAQYNYAKAIEILHQFIQKADPKTKLEATLLMADCYRLQNDMQDARSWYFKAIKMGNNDPLTYFYYGKALRACGDYEAAKNIFLKYDSLMPDDHRGKIYASFCDSAMAWEEKPFAYEVNNARNLNSASSEFGPIFYNDGVVFTTDKIMSTDEGKKSGWAGHGYLKLVFADPKQKDDYYGEYNLPKLIPELYSSGSNDGPATFSKDGNEVFLTRTIKTTDKSKDASEDGQSNQLKIFSATKTGDKWSKLKPFFFNSNNYSVGYPALSPDGNSLYFVSDVEGGYGGTDLYVTSRDGGNWSTPVNLGPIVNTFGDETFPFMADNGDLYFASDGHPGYGGLDIFVTRKVGNVWLNPQNLGKPINSSYDDFALAMYKNDSVGLFSANRPGGRGEDDIYTFRVVSQLPALVTQPAIAAVQKPVPQQEIQPAPAENVVPTPAPVTAEQKVQPAPVENVVPTPAPVTAEQKVQPAPVENVVPTPAPVTAEVTPPVEQEEVYPEPEITPKEEIQPAVTVEQKVSPTPAENVVPMSAPVTAEVTQPAKQEEIIPEPKKVPQPEIQSVATAEQKVPPAPAENVVPTSAPVTAEQKVQPAPSENVAPTPAPVTAEQKVPPAPAENIVPAPAPVTAEQKVQPAPAENVVPVPAPVTAEQKVPPAPAENVVPTPAPVTAEQKVQPALAENVVPAPAPVTAEQKVQPAPAENVVPAPAPVTAEQKVQPAPTENVVPAPAPVTAEQKVQPAPAENVVPAPAPVVAQVTPPEQKQEVPPQPKVTPQEEVKPALTATPNNPKIVVSGCIKDGTTHEAIPTATVFFLNENSGQVFIHKANETGCFRSELLIGMSYRIKAMQTGYSSDCVPFFSSTSDNQTETVISNDLLLEKIGVIHTYKVDNIYYDFDRYFIRPDAKPNLNKLVQIMSGNPVTVELSAHADCRGSDAYNMILTKKRASSAANYIIQSGIDSSRIVRHWYGKSRLVNNCNCAEGIHCTEAQHQLNRRCEFSISIPPAVMTESVMNLEKYREGDTLDIRLLPPDFFKNCNHRTLSGPLAELLNSSTLLPSDENSIVFYTVQIGAFSYLTPHFNNLSDVKSCKGNDGILRCFVGKFSSKKEAIWYRDHLRSGEFKDAFVAVMDEKHNPSATNQIVFLSKK
jgi:outer membrane protein OmpA-like peptidoglycan-associated protein